MIVTMQHSVIGKFMRTLSSEEYSSGRIIIMTEFVNMSLKSISYKFKQYYLLFPSIHSTNH